MANSGLLIKAVYGYTASDSKVLNCSVGEWFIIIKQSDPQNDWLYVVNSKGRLGYVPSNYTEIEQSLDDRKLLELIDNIISVLDINHNDSKIITMRQINHAQVKLTQMRCEVVNRLYSNCSPSPDPLPRNHPVIHSGPVVRQPFCEASNIRSFEPPPKKEFLNASVQVKILDNTLYASKVEQTDSCIETKDVTEPNRSTTNRGSESEQVLSEKTNDTSQPPIDESLAVELIERMRLSTELSHNMCVLSIVTVIKFLSEKLPSMDKSLGVLLEKLASVDQNISPEMMKNSSDLTRLRAVFEKLWHCRNDQQQRGWPIDDDTEVESSLTELVKLLANANPGISRKVIFSNDWENINTIVSFFNMETKKSLKMQLYSVLMEIVRLNDNKIEDNLLSTVLPSSLAAEMMNHQDDVERWSKASVLFTWMFGSGRKPPVNIYENIEEKFISNLLNLVELEDAEGQKIEHNIPPEMSIPPILAFNLHFDQPESNTVLKALKTRKSANRLVENIVSYLNWEEDPTLLVNYFGENMRLSNDGRPNAVHKLLIEAFQDSELENLFYYNDIKVMVDILITHLTNMQTDNNRGSYIRLLQNIVRNSSFKEEPYKIDEIRSCLDSIMNCENLSSDERNMVQTLQNSVAPSPPPPAEF